MIIRPLPFGEQLRGPAPSPAVPPPRPDIPWQVLTDSGMVLQFFQPSGLLHWLRGPVPARAVSRLGAPWRVAAGLAKRVDKGVPLDEALEGQPVLGP